MCPLEEPLLLSVSTNGTRAGVSFFSSPSFSFPIVEIVLSRLCAHVLYCSVSRAHLSDSGARQSAKDAGARLSRLISPSVSLRLPRETLFLSARLFSLLSCAHIRGHGPRAGAQNRGSSPHVNVRICMQTDNAHSVMRA